MWSSRDRVICHVMTLQQRRTTGSVQDSLHLLMTWFSLNFPNYTTRSDEYFCENFWRLGWKKSDEFSGFIRVSKITLLLCTCNNKWSQVSIHSNWLKGLRGWMIKGRTTGWVKQTNKATWQLTAFLIFPKENVQTQFHQRTNLHANMNKLNSLPCVFN